MKENLKKIFQDISSGKFSQTEALEKIRALKLQEQVKTAGVLLSTPVWEVAVSRTHSQIEYVQRHIILCEMPQVKAQQLEALLPGSQLLTLQTAPQQHIAERYESYALSCFEHIRHILSNKPQGQTLVQIVTAGEGEQMIFSGISGLLKTAALENPRLTGQLLLTRPGITADELAVQLEENKINSEDQLIKYEQGTRYVLNRKDLPASRVNPKVVFKDHGVYLITGGLGGLGILFTKEILKQTTHSRIILTGRFPLTAAKKAMLDALPVLNNKVTYQQADLLNLEEVFHLIASIHKDDQSLNGIIHCAGMTSDNFIIKKSKEAFTRVLAPKVTGTFNLDEAAKDLDLDFLVLFSSVASIMGNVGQADYAAANGFMDQFAAYRNQLVAAGRRQGLTLSVNWPLWQDGGMQIDPANREILQQTMDVQPMETIMGMHAFYCCMELRQDQVLVMPGNTSQPVNTGNITRELPKESLSIPVAAVAAHINHNGLFEKTEDYLRHEFSSLLKLEAHKIDPQAALEKYGIDSILAMSLTTQLEKTFGSLSKTLFFEYGNVRELTGYFVKFHQARLTALFHPEQMNGNGHATINTLPKASDQVQHKLIAGKRFISSRPSTDTKNTIRPIHTDLIAIVGLSGRYPDAANPEIFWRNLREGKDGITEVPASRWDWRAYYTEDRTQSGHHYSKWGGFIDGVDEFDPRFFNIAPREAGSIDPQERLFLQHAWMAVEDAGYTRSSLQIPHEDGLAGQVGVYAGVMYGEYNLSGSLASIANRVSYFLNLHGPSITLDTMCSSSLTAIHLACQDLKLGRTDLGIAGGVNVSIHPNKYLMLSAGQFISGDGHCQSFGEGGDGYIPGEGVGVVVLKRLSEAERDGNHIYGIIRGSALNHGGKTNGYSVPNPNAQAAAIKRALKDANTDPRHVSYLEAHGTGTKLGDPIEIAALCKAFHTSDDTGYCLIGSAKSNIGHCESAAGIAGLTKVLLQLQHRQIVPSLHSARLNPHIDFEKTPFIVNQTLKDWEAPVINGKILPRIAGISSFGAGGSNAHLIVQEYAAPDRRISREAQVVILLSARTSDQLQQKAQELLAYIREHQRIDLMSLAYTLQVGREAMDERMGFVVSSMDELSEKLQGYLNGVESVYQGKVKRDQDALPAFNTDTLEKWIKDKQLFKLPELWVKGLELDWNLLYGEEKPTFIPLPAYPFSRERYWADVAATTQQVPVSVLHPLLHSNTSDLTQQSYSTTFSGNEFFISNDKVLAAVIYPEMARAAMAQALPSSAHLPELHNIVWADPVKVIAPKAVNIALLAKSHERVDFEIYTTDDEVETVHCQGEMMISRQPAPPALDITHLKQQMTAALLHEPAYQGITSIHRGNRQLLAHITLPAGIELDDAYILHPAIVDTALQAGMALIADNGPSLFNSINTLRIISACTREMYCWVRSSGDKTDIDLCDLKGNICVQLHGVHYQESMVQPSAKQEVAELPVPSQLGPRQIHIPRFTDVQKFTQITPGKPTNVALVVPKALEAINRMTAKKGTVNLSVTSGIVAADEVSYINLFDNGNGIYAIKTDSMLTPAVVAQLQGTLEFLKQTATIKVLMLEGSDTVFLQGGRDAYNEAVTLQLFQTIVSFPCPVIAVMQGDATGAGFLVGALCDFMICSEESRYSYTDMEAGMFPALNEELLFNERFGEVLAKDFLYQFTGFNGRDLKERGWTCPVLPSGQVAAYTQQLALDLSAKSTTSLRLLKQHLGRHIMVLTQQLTSKSDATDAAQIYTISITAGKKKDKLKDVIADLSDVIARINQHTAYKAIVISSDDPEFIPVSGLTDEVSALQRLILDAPVPVIAAITSHAKGVPWLISQYCDACIYSEEGEYSLAPLLQTPELVPQAALIFSHRSGNAACREILLTGKTFTGIELQRLTGTIAAKEEVVTKAMELAATWAGMPMEDIITRKKILNEKIKQLQPWTELPEVSAILPQTPTAIALTSKVINAVVHPEGIVEVKMEDREAKNMFSPAFIEGMIAIFAHIAATPAYKVVILTGYDSYFASGGTKESLLAIQEGKAKFTDTRIFQLAMDCQLPVIAAMQGHGIGAGWSMGMFSDFILFSEESHYVSPYMRYGFTPGAGATLIFPDKTGYDLARETLLTANEYSGEELKNKGLCYPVLSRKELLSAAFTLARQIAQHPRNSLIAAKQQINSHLHARIAETCHLELAMHEQTFVGQADTLQQIENNFYNEDGTTQVQAPPVEDPMPSAPQSASPATDALSGIVSGLKTLLSQELHLHEHEIDENSQFVDLGLDSITGVTFIRKINDKYKTGLQATIIYSYATLAKLSSHVKEEAEKQGTLIIAPVAPVMAAVPVTAPRKVMVHPEAGIKLTSWRNKASLRTSSPAKPVAPSQPIAVVGMAGQFPGAKDIETFWQNIAGGKNCISEIPAGRWNMDHFYQEGEAVPGKSYSKWMGALEGYDLFDPLFFNISPSEAESMDPQQRLFLQSCWHAIENAGYNPQDLSGSKCGIFVGCAAGDYLQQSQKHQLSAHGFTGAASSILSARISYFLNLQGPCISIDTACSSSLVAIANACDSLVTGSSNLALAGGVYVMATPSMHIMSSQSGMLSPDGRCYTFDQRANGFVPGEGVGVIMLKRLEDAEKDHDHIYGVIQGWGINQDGKTNGITAPNTESQAMLEQQVYDRFRIDPNNIQLIETHGTGTKLGDPIEVEGLRRSFKKYTQEKEYCALTSVKSNIGHCLTAAGVAGVIKVLQAIKHRQLPPTINFEKLNEHIRLDDSPFYVNTQLKDWKVKDTERRQAGISSFGFSGTNAHLVLGEYLPETTPAAVITQHPAYMIPLSARSVDQLKQKAADLLACLQKEHASVALIDVAYTLQVGREPMEERIGFMVGSTAQLAEKLQAFINGEEGIADVYQGQVKRNKEGLRIISNDDEIKDTIIEKWISRQKFSKLLDLWVKGLDLDWNKFYGDQKPRRISLPVYPFAKERYWIEKSDKLTAAKTTAVLHPLLHANTSDLRRQSYSTTFSGEEFFMYDKTLPAMVCLEMARAAVMLADAPRDKSTVELRNISWMQPIANNALSTALFANDTGEQISIEIYNAEGEAETTYFQGQANYSHTSATLQHNIAPLKGQMKRAATPNDIYAALTRMGVNYSPAHQGITAVYRGVNQLLAELSLPFSGAGDQHEFMLHPIIMEGALQAGISLITELKSFPHPLMPVSLEMLRILSPCTTDMIAWVRVNGTEASGDTLDIDLMDHQGHVCVQMHGLSLQAYAADTEKMAPASEEASLPLFFQEYWQEQPIPSNGISTDNRQFIIFADEALQEKMLQDDATGRWASAIFVFQGNRYKEVADNVYHCRFNNAADLQKILTGVTGKSTGPVALMYTWAKGQQETGIHALFDLFKVIKGFDQSFDIILAGHYEPSASDTCWDYSWIGFERSLKLLLPHVRISILYTDSSTYTPQQLLDAVQHPGIIRYEDQRRFTLSFKSADPGNSVQTPVLRINGRYLITGGCGQLGFSFALHLAKAWQAKLVLLGRSPLTPGIQEKIDQLKEAGAQEVSYEAVNISDRKALTSWVRKLPYNLFGVIHAAGVEGTRYFHEKTMENINEVLQPKTTGTILLDELLDRHPLDFVCYFSSSAALLGDFGSCDYAIANRFQMAYAHHRQLKKQGNGKSIVINWPFWKEGGMGKGDAEQAAFYLKSSGQDMLETTEGLEIWHNIIRTDQTQVLVLKGKPSRVEQFLQRIYVTEQQTPSPAGVQSLPAHTGKGWKPQYQDLSLKECIYTDLTRMVSANMKISPEKLDGTTNLADYGFDSISLTAFARQLKEHFSLAITPALFFNYSSMEKLSDHFVQDHLVHMQEFYSQPQSTGDDHKEIPVPQPAGNKTSSRKRFLQTASNGSVYAARGAEEPIAVIGMSGRFPKADTVEQLWSLLEKGESGISEIPLSRWNWTDYFTTPGDPANKISTNKGGFINNVDEFDPMFFEITPREAEATDPGQRLLLMEAYKAIEDAQIDPSSLRGSPVGVFVGMEESQYDQLVADEQGVGNSGNAMISSRLSYYLDLHGPAIATNTACSSGLVALHQAIMSLRNGECDTALVAGISAFILSPVFYMKMSQAGMLSKDGQCYSFARNANGIGAGEAVVVLMLKPLSAAIAAGNPVYGVIRASGINFDGKTNGVTAPNGKSQEELIKSIYSRYHINPQDVSHIVAHGTGTKLGDPIELNALNEAFRQLTKEQPDANPSAHCAITSCKSNLGHTMAASGLVSVVGLLKGLQHNKIPATINCEDENDYITWENSPFYINKTTKEWEKERGKPRMGGVSSFGRSGTNAHVVIEEYVAPVVAPATHPGNDTQVIIALSAKTPEQLQQKAADLLEFINTPDETFDLPAIAYSLQVTREAMEVRLGLITGSIQELAGKLRAYLTGEKNREGVYQGEVKNYDTSVSIFNADADLQETVDKWITNRKLSKLLELWVKGLKLDWNKLYGEVKPRRIPLPKYPFAREKYWVSKAASKQVNGSSPVASDKNYGIIEDLINQIESESIETDLAVSLLKNIAYPK